MIECSTPPAKGVHPVKVEVSNNGVDFRSYGGGSLKVMPQSTVVSINPTSGILSGGTLVTVKGTAFRNAANVQCKFGGYKADARFVSSNEISCVTPFVGTFDDDLSSVEFNICYGSADATAMGSESCAHRSDELSFQFTSNLLVTKMVPASGPISGSTEVAVTVSSSSAATVDPSLATCKFGDDNVVGIDRIEDNVIFCTSPPATNSLGSSIVNFEVSPNGRDFSTSNGQFNYYKNAEISSIAPIHVPEHGGSSIQVNGVNFLNLETLVCKFESNINKNVSEVFVDGIYISDSSMRCKIPKMMPQDGMRLFVGNSPSELSPTFATLVVEPALSLSKIVPEFGPSSGSSIMTLHGTNFVPSGKMSCRFGEEIVPAHYVSGDSIQCVVPGKGLSAAVVVSVSRNSVDYSDSTMVYTYTENESSAMISSVEPRFFSVSSLNGAGEMELVVKGRNFMQLLGEEAGNVYCVLNFRLDDGEGEGTPLDFNSLSPVDKLSDDTINCSVSQHGNLKFANLPARLEVSEMRAKCELQACSTSTPE